MKIPVPERGQPLDLSYVYKITEAVNQLSESAVYSANRFVSVDTPGAGVGRQDVKVTDTRMVAGYKEVVNGTTITQGAEIPFFYNFDVAEFKYPPIVSATPQNVSGTEAGKDVSVVLTFITASRVEGVVRFNTTGSVSVGVHIIAIGVPN